MVYILSYTNNTLGVFETIELLRLNLMIHTYKMYEQGVISKRIYDEINDILDTPNFDTDTLKTTAFENLIGGCNFRITQKVAQNEYTPLNNIKKHIEERFQKLEEIMKKHSIAKVTFPGESSEDHSLGKPYLNVWNLLGENGYKMYKEMYNFISKKMEGIEEKFGLNDRVFYGNVDYENMKNWHFQVWSANKINYNTPIGERIMGKYQARDVRIQNEYSFPIIVYPLYGYENI